LPCDTSHSCFKKVSGILLALTGVFALLYLWFTLFPGEITPEAYQYFRGEELERGRSYVLALRLVYISSFIVKLVFLLWFLGSGRAEALAARCFALTRMRVWPTRILFFLVFWLILQLLSLPFSLFANYYWQHHWGFSTQTLISWWQDYFLSSGLSLVLTLAGVLLLFAAMELWPRRWWFAGAVFSVFWLFLQVFLWPVVISPLFNQFAPVQEIAVVEMVEELSTKTGLVIDEVLVMDASRRTTASNAYFTGLGSTKRIVLYDNLLKDFSPAEVKAVVAHEMAHWQHGHVFKGMLWGSLGTFFLWAVFYLFLGCAFGKQGFYPPHTVVIIVLFLLVVNFLASPVENYFSRQMEREADRTAVMLTADIPAALSLQVNLAVKNRGDVSPPPFLEWFAYSHPSTLNRIKAFKKLGNN
jgi:STE24 endopeptidase